jgi:hypothetical protein
MKRIILVALLLVSFGAITNAQIKFGIKAGVTSTSIKADDVIAVEDQTTFDELVLKSQNAKIGFQGGVFARISLLKLYIQPELLFTSSSSEVEVTSLNNGAEVESAISEQKYRQIDFPIMIGYKFGPARIQAGPVGTIMLSSDPSLNGFMNMDYDEEYNGATWGYQVGAGLDILKKLTIDLKYEGSFSNLGDGIQLGDQNYNFDSRNSKIILTLGWIF